MPCQGKGKREKTKNDEVRKRQGSHDWRPGLRLAGAVFVEGERGGMPANPFRPILNHASHAKVRNARSIFAKSPKPIRQRVHKAPVRSRISSAVPEKSSRLLFCRRRGKRRRWKPQGTDNRPWRPIRFDCDAEQPVCASDEAPEQPTSAANAEGPEES